MADQWMHVLRVECEGVVARVSLNGVEVFADWEGASRVTQTKVDGWVIEGANVLEIELTQMTDDDGELFGGARSFELELVRGAHGVDPGDTGRIARWAWDETRVPVEPGVLSSVWSRQFSVIEAHSHGRWAWQDAPTARKEAVDPGALLRLVQSVHTALEQRDLGGISSLTRLKSEELARALGVDMAEIEDGERAMWQEVFADASWSVESFDPTNIAAVPMAEGRLVKITDALGGPAVKGTTGEKVMGFTITVTRVAGAWVIAR